MESLGETLLHGPPEAFDFTLCITDGRFRIPVRCHSCVLLTYSPVFTQYMREQSRFTCTWKVDRGYLGAAMELIQFLYLRRLELVSHRDKVLELAAFLRMPSLFFHMNTHVPLPEFATQKLFQVSTPGDTDIWRSTVSFLRVLPWTPPDRTLDHKSTQTDERKHRTPWKKTPRAPLRPVTSSSDDDSEPEPPRYSPPLTRSQNHTRSPPLKKRLRSATK